MLHKKNECLICNSNYLFLELEFYIQWMRSKDMKCHYRFLQINLVNYLLKNWIYNLSKNVKNNIKCSTEVPFSPLKGILLFRISFFYKSIGFLPSFSNDYLWNEYNINQKNYKNESFKIINEELNEKYIQYNSDAI